VLHTDKNQLIARRFIKKLNSAKGDDALFTNDLNTWWKAIFQNQKQAWLTMHSGSMYPLMPTGSQILVKSIEHQQINVGDIVLYIEKNKFIAHRVLKINAAENQCLQGDDNTISTSFISIDSIIGVVKKIKKANGKEFDLSNRAGVLLTRFITITCLGIIVIRRRCPKVGYLLHRLKILLVRILVT
jgi:signal peptidase I